MPTATSKTEKHFRELTKLKPKPGQAHTEFLHEIIRAGQEIPEEQWNELTSREQNWYNDSIKALANSKGDSSTILDPADYDAEPEAEPEPEEEAVEEEAVEEEAAEGDEAGEGGDETAEEAEPEPEPEEPAPRPARRAAAPPPKAASPRRVAPAAPPAKRPPSPPQKPGKTPPKGPAPKATPPRGAPPRTPPKGPAPKTPAKGPAPRTPPKGPAPKAPPPRGPAPKAPARPVPKGPAPRKGAGPLQPTGEAGVQAIVKRMIIRGMADPKHPQQITTAELLEEVEKLGRKITRQTVAQVRSDFRDTIRLLQEFQNKQPKGYNLLNVLKLE